MEAKELDRLIACAELRNPKVYNASRERYIAEISFKAGMRKVVELSLQAIKDEPEFPGDMPDELWGKIDGDREMTQRVMQNTVRITKQYIKERLQAFLEEQGL